MPQGYRDFQDPQRPGKRQRPGFEIKSEYDKKKEEEEELEEGSWKALEIQGISDILDDSYEEEDDGSREREFGKISDIQPKPAQKKRPWEEEAHFEVKSRSTPLRGNTQRRTDDGPPKPRPNKAPLYRPIEDVGGDESLAELAAEIDRDEARRKREWAIAAEELLQDMNEEEGDSDEPLSVTEPEWDEDLYEEDEDEDGAGNVSERDYTSRNMRNRSSGATAYGKREPVAPATGAKPDPVAKTPLIAGPAQADRTGGGSGSLVDRYRAARQQALSESDRATKDADQKRWATHLGEALEGLVRAQGMARGGQGVDSGFYGGLRGSIDQREKAARDRANRGVTDLVAEEELGFEDAKRARQKHDWQAKDAVLARQKDPNSTESQVARALAKRVMPSGKWDNANAHQVLQAMPFIETLYKIENAKVQQDILRERMTTQSFNEAARVSNDQFKADSQAQNWKAVDENADLNRQLNKMKILADIEAERERLRQNSEKNAAAAKSGQNKVDEANYRYNILNQNAAKLRKLVEENGTVDLLGSEGTQMDKLIYEMAIDYAKLVDPDSVAREGEVEAAKKYMLPIRQYGGFGTNNKTALDLIDDYTRGLGTRIKARNDAKGSSNPAPSSGRKPAPYGETVKQRGKTFHWNGREYIEEGK
jgi:hypothetical protein